MLFNNPSMHDLQAVLASPPNRDFTIQFSEPSAYDAAHLALVNEICGKAGRTVSVRFYGHNSSTIDCASFAALTECRSLFLNSHGPVANIQAIASMSPLDTFGIDVFEGSYDEVLRYSSVQSATTLYIGTNRKTDWDLAPLRDFVSLRTLSVVGQHKNLALVGKLDGIRSLSLYSIPRKVSLAFISSMAGLNRLTVMLGGRDYLEGVAHPGVSDLEVIWVKGLTHLDCARFPALEALKVEDQARLAALDLTGNPELRRVHISNCRVIAQLEINGLDKLCSLFIGRTAIDPEAFLSRPMPAALTAIDLWGYGSRRDAEIEALLRSRGYRTVYRDQLH